MLKIHKNSSDFRVHIVLGTGERLATRAFLQALGISLFLHLSGWLFFQITPLKLKEEIAFFPPVEVVLDTSSSGDQGVVAQPKGHDQEISGVAKPILIFPKWEFRCGNLEKDLTACFQVAFKLKTDPSIGLGNAQPVLMEPSTDLDQNIRLFGSLYGRRFSVTGEALHPKGAEQDVRHLAVYHVKVDDRTGKIFWAEGVGESLGKSLEKRARRVLRKIAFEKRPESFMSEGRIELELADD